MNVENIDVVLNVADIEASQDFYQKLGFELTSSDVAGGLSVLTHSRFRLVLMRGHVKGNMLNLRPTDMSDLLPQLKEKFPKGTVMAEG